MEIKCFFYFNTIYTAAPRRGTTTRMPCSSPSSGRKHLALLPLASLRTSLSLDALKGDRHKRKRYVLLLFLQAVGEELVQLGDLGGDGEVDGSVADLDDEPTQDIRVHLVSHLQLLALAVLGLGDGGLETAEGLVV